jgi:hypothetical protein
MDPPDKYLYFDLQYVPACLYTTVWLLPVMIVVPIRNKHALVSDIRTHV